MPREALAIIGKNEIYRNPFWFKATILESHEEFNLSDLPSMQALDTDRFSLTVEVH